MLPTLLPPPRRPSAALQSWLLVAAIGALCLPPEAFWRSIVLAPWLEEAVLRWGIHAPLAARWDAGHPGIAPWLLPLLVAALFASLHLLLAPGSSDLPRAAATLLPAWWIGLIYQRHRRLAPCVAWHAAFNLAWLAGLSRLAA